MRRLLACAIAVTAYLSMWSTPASASPSSPRPTAQLLRTGLIATPDGKEAYIKVKGHDPDAIITELDVLWGDGSVSFASSYPCLIAPTPAPGTPHKFLVSHKYTKPGTYTVKYVIYSVSDCSASGYAQHSREYRARLTSP